jgi:tripartite motif-containing protein 2/3
MDSLRTAVKSAGETLKNIVDIVVSENTQEVDNIEKSLLEELQNQDTTFGDYISYLHDLLKELYGYMSSRKLSKTISKLFERFPDIQPLPETRKLVTPVFTTSQYSKDDVAKSLGKISFENKKAEMRKIKAMEIASPSTSKQKDEDMHQESDGKPAMSLSSSVTEVRDFTAPGVDLAFHVSPDKSGRFWVSDSYGNLVHTDLEGNELQEIQTSDELYGHHTVTQDGELIFTDTDNNVINKITKDNEITKFSKTGDWAPLSIHSSRINGNILVGMVKNGEAKVTRYNEAGKELQKIQKDTKGQRLYSEPRYITENINGDVGVSDHNKNRVVVVNRSGQHRFSYTGHGPGFWPYAICTDVLGHILVCDGFTDTIHLLNQDGQFLSLLLSKQHGIDEPRSVCVDDDSNLYVGQRNTVTVYKYLW